MLLNIGICDDEKQGREKLLKYLTTYSVGHNVDFKTVLFSSGEEVVKYYDENNSPFDILFLDVEMKGMSGIEAAESIRKMPDRNVLIIFVTSYPEYMQDSFDVQAAQYIVKPVSYDFFAEKLNKTFSYYESLETNIAIMTIDDEERVFYLEDIVYFETEKNSTTKAVLRLNTVDNSFIIKGKIQELEQKLKDQYFVSVHRSVLVNLKYIKRFLGDSVELVTGKTLNMSRRKASKIKDDFSKFIMMRYKR